MFVEQNSKFNALMLANLPQIVSSFVFTSSIACCTLGRPPLERKTGRANDNDKLQGVKLEGADLHTCIHVHTGMNSLMHARTHARADTHVRTHTHVHTHQARRQGGFEGFAQTPLLTPKKILYTLL